MKKIVVYILFLAVFYQNQNSSNAQWIETNGPEGGFVYSLSVKDSKVFAGTYWGMGVYMSTDSGASWFATTSQMMISRSVTSFAFSGVTIFAGTLFDGVFKSTDDGVTWTEANSGLTNTKILSLCVTGTNLFAGTDGGGVFLSTDDGETWFPVNTGLTNSYVRTLAVLGTDLFAGTLGGGVFFSTNDGASWSSVNVGLTDSYINVMSTDGTNLYAGTGNGVFLSTNGGTNWTAKSNGLTSPNVLSFTIKGTNLFAGTVDGGIHISTNNGTNWSPVNEGLINKTILSAVVLGEKIFVGTDGAGVFRSTNNGTFWTSANKEFINTDVLALAIDGLNIFAGTRGGGIFRSTDNGDHWVSVNTGLTDPYITSLIFKGTDIYAGTWFDGIFKSTDFGSNWNAVNSGISNLTINSFEIKGTNLFVGTGDGVYTSSNDGSGWSAVNNGLTQTNVLSLVANGQNLFAGTSDSGVFLSTNNGSSWTPVNSGLADRHIWTLTTSGANLFAGTWGGGVFRSTNNGLNWISLGPPDLVFSFEAVGSCIFTGIFMGLRVSVNGGDSWRDVNTGLGFWGPRSLSAGSDYLFGGLGARGVWRRSLSEMLPFGSISGIVFNDSNANSYRDIYENGIEGWKIFLKDSNNVLVDSAVTGTNGSYLFEIPSGGDYTVSEFQDSEWVQTYPPGSGSHTVTISGTDFMVGKDFGNTRGGNRYTGGPTGEWSRSTNWQNGSVPGPENAVSIPSDVVVIVDSLPRDTIKAIKIESGGAIQFSPAIGQLKVLQSVLVDPTATLQFPESSDSTGITCFKDWVNRGTIDPGHSIVKFNGNDPKIIASESASNTFYKLEIAGDSTSTFGNVIIKDKMILRKGILLRDQDSIIVENNDTSAISDTGIVICGTIKRNIDQGVTGAYRFESPDTYLKFSGEGINPGAVAISAIPRSTPGNLLWDSLGGRVDTVKNTLIADTVRRFSKWVFGIPRPRTVTGSGLLYGIDPVNRIYIINPEGGSDYRATISLRYNQDEVPPAIVESQLRLLRGPYFADSVQGKWNMISLPLTPDSPNKDSLFPMSASGAFAYVGTYEERTNLDFGSGYWLKFEMPQQLIMEGDDRDSMEVQVNDGWNMIGMISYPIAAGSVTSMPPDIIGSDFFGYTSGYQIEDSLKPLHSYWVKTGSSGKLILSVGQGVSFTKGSSLRSGLDRYNTLDVDDDQGNKGRLYFGFGGDTYSCDLPPIPPEGTFDVRYSTGKYLAVPAKQITEYAVQINSAEYPVRIRWVMKDLARSASLIIDGRSVNLHQSGSVEVGNPKSEIKLKLSYGRSDKMPTQFALYQNYPNPFNAKTKIEYDLPIRAEVTIRIYNILGQLVKVLKNEIQEAGFKSVEWDAGGLTSGVYVYRLNADTEEKSVSLVKKLLLIK